MFSQKVLPRLVQLVIGVVVIGACVSMAPHFFSDRDELHGRDELNALNAMAKLAAQREISAGQVHTHAHTHAFIKD